MVSKKRVSSSASAEVMIPVLNDLAVADTRSTIDLTNINLEASISFKLVSWASLDYQIKAVREPQLIGKFQLQDNLLLTFACALLKSGAKK